MIPFHLGGYSSMLSLRSLFPNAARIVNLAFPSLKRSEKMLEILQFSCWVIPARLAERRNSTADTFVCFSRVEVA